MTEQLPNVLFGPRAKKAPTKRSHNDMDQCSGIDLSKLGTLTLETHLMADCTNAQHMVMLQNQILHISPNLKLATNIMSYNNTILAFKLHVDIT